MFPQVLHFAPFRNVDEYYLALQHWRSVPSYESDDLSRAAIVVHLLGLTPTCTQVTPSQLRAVMLNNSGSEVIGGMSRLFVADSIPRLVAPPSCLCRCGGRLGPLRRSYDCERTLVTVNQDAVPCLCYEAACESASCNLVQTASYVYECSTATGFESRSSHNNREYTSSVPFAGTPYFVYSRSFVFEAGFFPLHLIDLERTSLSAQALEEMASMKIRYKPHHASA